MAVDPVGLLHRVEGGPVLGEDFAAALDAVVADQEIEIVPERLGEFGLGVHQVHDPQIGREPARIGVEGRAGDAALGRVRPQALDAVAESSAPRRGSLRWSSADGPELPGWPLHSDDPAGGAACCGAGTVPVDHGSENGSWNWGS